RSVRRHYVRTGKEEGVPLRGVDRVVAVARHAPGRLARDAGDRESPTHTKEAVAVPGAVDEAELRLEAVAPRWQGDRHDEVAGAGVQVRGEGLLIPWSAPPPGAT